MTEESVRRLQDAPDRSLLVRPERNDGASTGQGQVIAVKGADTDVIEFVIVEPDQTLPALIIPPNP